MLLLGMTTPHTMVVQRQRNLNLTIATQTRQTHPVSSAFAFVSSRHLILDPIEAPRTRKKGRRPRPRPVNEEPRPPPSAPHRSVELGEPGSSTQRAHPRNSRAALKRKSDSTPQPEFDRADKRRRLNTDRDAARIRLESREDEPGQMASCDSLGYESLREEEPSVRPRRIRRLTKRQQWDEASYHEDDNSRTRSPGPGEPGPSTWAQSSEQELVPSPRNVDSPRSRANMPARTSKPASRRKSKNSRRFRCPHCGLGNSREAQTFKRANDLRRHLIYHAAHKSDNCDKSRLECPDCHKIFSRPDSLIRHRGNPSACAKNIAPSLKEVERSEEDSDYEEEEDSDQGE